MRTHTIVVLVVFCAAVALCVCGQAQTGDNATALPALGAPPIVTSPSPNTQVGPATLVVGRAAHGSLIVIHTEIFDAEDGTQYYRPIPGHRHLVNPDGSFALLISTPRTFFWVQRPVRYEIHVYAITPDGQKSPHTVIPVKQTPPSEE